MGRASPNSFKSRILALRKAEPDLKYRAIADRVGCAYEYVKWVCQKNGAATRKAYSPIKRKYFELRKKHPEWSAHRIAIEIGAAPSAIYKLVRRCDDTYVSITELGLVARAAGLTVEKIKQMGAEHGR